MRFRGTGRWVAGMLVIVQALMFTGESEAQVRGRGLRFVESDTAQAAESESAWGRWGITHRFFYAGEGMANLRGGIERGSSWQGVADYFLTFDPAMLTGWNGSRLGLNVIGVHGGHPGHLIGDYQGVSNIAAPTTLRLSELWLRQRLFQDRLSVLVGIYDINSAFDVLETAAIFLNSSSGMGPEFSHSGPHGAPTYPYPGLSLLVRTRLFERLEWLNLLADGSPGDPEDPAKNSYRIGGDQGWLIGSEVAWVTGREVLELLPSVAPRWEARRLRMGVGPMRQGVVGPGRGLRGRRMAATHAPEAQAPVAEPVARHYGKIALGLWHNTASLTLPPAPGQTGDPITRQGSGGAYLLAERSISNRQLPSLRSWSGHLRIGVADGRSELIDRYAGFGIVCSRPIVGASPDQIGLAVTAARLSRTYVDRIGIDQDARRWEIGIEWTIRLRLTEWLALQPDIQYIIHPGFDPDRAHALVAGLRLDLAR